MSSSTPLHLTETSFENAVAASHSRPVLIDFWATWCGPCKAQAPVLDQLAASHGARSVIAKIDVDEAPGVASRFAVRSIPTLIVLRNGVEVARYVGLQSAAALDSALTAAA